MSGYKDSIVSVRQSQVDNWTRSASNSAATARTCEGLRAQQASIDAARKADAEQLQREINEQTNRSREAANRLATQITRVDTGVRSEISRQITDQNSRRERLQNQINSNMQALEQRTNRAINGVADSVDMVSDEVDRLAGNIQETAQRVQDVRAEMDTKLDQETSLLRDEMQRITQKLEASIAEARAAIAVEMERRLEEIGTILDDHERRLAIAEIQLETIQRERAIAIDRTASLTSTYEIILQDMETNLDSNRFCPTELQSIKEDYALAVAQIVGLDPSAGVARLSSVLFNLISLRARVVYSEGHYCDLKYEYLTELAYLEQISTPSFLVASSEENTDYLFNLNEMSNGALEAFRQRLRSIRLRLEATDGNLETIASIGEDMKPLAADYNAIVGKAILYEAASELASAKARDILNNLTAAGFRFEAAVRMEDQSLMIVVSTAINSEVINRVVIDVQPIVEGAPARVAIRYGQRMYAVDRDGNYLEGYDSASMRLSLGAVRRATGADLTEVKNDGSRDVNAERRAIDAAIAAAGGKRGQN